MDGLTNVTLTNAEAQAWQKFLLHYDLLKQTGFFDMKRGSITYHYNAEGKISGFEVHQVSTTFDNISSSVILNLQ